MTRHSYPIQMTGTCFRRQEWAWLSVCLLSWSVPSSNPVRRIGKAPGYDDDFAAVVDAAKAANYQGSVSVVRTYQPPALEVRIGMVDLGGFPLELSMLLALF